MVRIRVLVGSVLLAGAALCAAPASADTATSVSITAGPTRIEFLGRDAGPTQPVTAWIQGARPGTITFSLVDAIPDPEGGWISVPLGSASASLRGLASLAPSSFRYEPDGTRQVFRSMLSVVPAALDGVHVGSVVITFRADATEDPGDSLVSTEGAVELQVLVAPSAEDLASLPGVSLGLSIVDLSLASEDPWTFLDAIIPDLPGVVNHGPVEVTTRGRNVGDVVLDQRVTYAFRGVSPFSILPFVDDDGGDGGYRVENVPRYLLPGQVFTDTLRSLIPATDGRPPLDALPFIGFVRIEATAIGSLSGIEAEPVSVGRTVLVFPWKETLAVILLWSFGAARRRRRIERAAASGVPDPSIPSRHRASLIESLRRRPASNDELGGSTAATATTAATAATGAPKKAASPRKAAVKNKAVSTEKAVPTQKKAAAAKKKAAPTKKSASTEKPAPGSRRKPPPAGS